MIAYPMVQIPKQSVVPWIPFVIGKIPKRNVYCCKNVKLVETIYIRAHASSSALLEERASKHPNVKLFVEREKQRFFYHFRVNFLDLFTFFDITMIASKIFWTATKAFLTTHKLVYAIRNSPLLPKTILATLGGFSKNTAMLAQVSRSNRSRYY